MSNKYLLAAILLLLALAPSRAFARLAVTPIVTPGQVGDDVDVDEERVNRELELFRAARVSVSQAMVIAEKLHAGSRTVDISFDGASGSSTYRVKTIQRNHLWEDRIDAQTGDITGTEIVSSLKDLNGADRNNLIALRTVRQALSDAVLVAERSASGKAISGGLMNEDGNLNFVIVVVSGDSLKQVILEPPRARSRGPVPRRSP